MLLRIDQAGRRETGARRTRDVRANQYAPRSVEGWTGTSLKSSALIGTSPQGWGERNVRFR
jgi:hypothetical protein